MSFLFIDSTYDLSLGVLDDEYKWLSFERFSGLKSSMILQDKSFELLKKHNLKPNDLTGVISMSGPGFYTGLRLSEGFSDVFKFFGVNTYSLYSYEIPVLCGFQEGIWFTKAYRGEYFFYSWNKDSSNHRLVSVKELAPSLFTGKVFIHSNISLDTISENIIPSSVHTHDLLQTNSYQIFNGIKNSLPREPFYFRAAEDEFKANP